MLGCLSGFSAGVSVVRKIVLGGGVFRWPMAAIVCRLKLGSCCYNFAE